MQVRLLGPLDVMADGAAQPVRGFRRAAVLAALALRSGEIASVDWLADVVWGDDAPRTALNTLQRHVSHLRHLLGSQDAISARPPGYVLNLGREATDVRVAEALIGQAVQEPEPGERARMLRTALALWRGQPLADVAVLTWMAEQAERLGKLQLRAIRALVEARMELGEHAQLIPELEGLTAAHRFDEPIHGQLMLALYRDGRQADALAVYQALRRTLGDEMGIDPGPPLRELEVAILRQDPALRMPARAAAPAAVHGSDRRARPAPPTPAQLPPAVPAFAGRRAELARLDAAGLDGAGGAVVAVSGTAGVGKTALAVHWAHQVAARFPDGQLYVNLHGFDPGGPELAPAEAVRGFLDALGVPAERIPAGLAAQTGLYRSLLAGKRMLVVLDNARHAGQVRALLPGSPGCLVIVTSRNYLTGLVATDGAVTLTLDLMPDDEARELLARRLGTPRVAGEPRAVAEIIAQCARLPLALAIAAAHAAAHPGFPLDTLAAELRDASGILDHLHGGDPATDVRAVFSWSYRALSTGAARMFRLLGLHPGPDIATSAAASLAGVPREQARVLLGELTRAHLITEHAPGRYTFHDLLRAYAAELARGHEAHGTGDAALHRLLDHYLHAAHAVAELINPVPDVFTPSPPQPGVVAEDIADHRGALAWFSAERPVLLAAIEHVPAGLEEYTWRLTSVLATFLDRLGHWHDQRAASITALAAANRVGDPAGQASALLSLGRACVGLTWFGEARGHYQRALALFGDLGNHTGQARTYHSLSRMAGAQARHQEALHHSRRALAHYQAARCRAGQAAMLNNIGWHRAKLGDYSYAADYCRSALAVHEEIGDLNGQAHTWDSLGYINRHLGHHDQAAECYRHALTLFRLTGDFHGEATCFDYLGEMHHAAGETRAARQAWEQALIIFDQLGHPDADQVRAKLDKQDLAGQSPDQQSRITCAT